MNHYENPDRTLAGREPRVVRGGAWGYDPHCARASYRYSYYPYNRFSLVGFRLCCSSPKQG